MKLKDLFDFEYRRVQNILLSDNTYVGFEEPEKAFLVDTYTCGQNNFEFWVVILNEKGIETRRYNVKYLTAIEWGKEKNEKD